MRWLILALVSLSVPGCAPSHTGLCERAADCGGGRDPEIEACVEDMDAREDEAEIFSCVEEWDRYLECLDDAGMCVDNALGGCESQRDVLNDCIGNRRAGQAKVQKVE